MRGLDLLHRRGSPNSLSLMTRNFLPGDGMYLFNESGRFGTIFFEKKDEFLSGGPVWGHLGADPGMAGKVCVSETTVHLHILAHASLPLSSYHREHMETEPFFLRKQEINEASVHPVEREHCLESLFESVFLGPFLSSLAAGLLASLLCRVSFQTRRHTDVLEI